ncbi:hypothetical protein HKD37_01G000845 [Glycine soja]
MEGPTHLFCQPLLTAASHCSPPLSSACHRTIGHKSTIQGQRQQVQVLFSQFPKDLRNFESLLPATARNRRPLPATAPSDTGTIQDQRQQVLTPKMRLMMSF